MKIHVNGSTYVYVMFWLVPTRYNGHKYFEDKYAEFFSREEIQAEFKTLVRSGMTEEQAAKLLVKKFCDTYYVDLGPDNKFMLFLENEFLVAKNIIAVEPEYSGVNRYHVIDELSSVCYSHNPKYLEKHVQHAKGTKFYSLTNRQLRQLNAIERSKKVLDYDNLIDVDNQAFIKLLDKAEDITHKFYCLDKPFENGGDTLVTFETLKNEVSYCIENPDVNHWDCKKNHPKHGSKGDKKELRIRDSWSPYLKEKVIYW